MKKVFGKRTVGLLSLVLLSAFLLTLFEASYEHFFHDVLPEHADSYFLIRGQATKTGSFSRPVASQPDVECPFNIFLSFLEKSIFDASLPHIVLHDLSAGLVFSDAINCSFNIGHFRRSRAPPFFYSI